ncbi:(Na+)-NQR maturation NqrM [Pseudohalioglobus sediminis]|uniref:(Na+)-NQR maturation NqrM n=1 Tax=Pseudohalioglobus sediminis TaxID=2606449 RepID=A0A5B0WQF3_9GAMM|nr:(Na+)-NQR maturation NqrM [Pseudohalioglobus sediminis]KAA1188229.1 (Na+)-NQR maturation NqrM [Pseudohalioglobus sediminis]
MSMFLISVLVIGLVMAGMAVGVIMGRPPIKGSCGGMGALGIDTACEICGGDPKRCDEETRDGENARARPELFYSADKPE